MAEEYIALQFCERAIVVAYRCQANEEDEAVKAMLDMLIERMRVLAKRLESRITAT
jgi:hypothetical protein